MPLKKNKLSKTLRKRAKQYHVKLKRKSNGKFVYKSALMIERQIQNKIAKKGIKPVSCGKRRINLNAAVPARKKLKIQLTPAQLDRLSEYMTFAKRK